MTNRRGYRSIGAALGVAVVTGVVVAQAFAALAIGDPPSAPATKPAEAPAAPREPAQLAPEQRQKVEHELRRIAAGYRAFARVSDDSVGWAPELCMGPPPPRVQPTRAQDDSPHGRKLYFLYARDTNAYLEMSRRVPFAAPCTAPFANPVGQVVVKEAFVPVPAPSERARYEDLQKKARTWDTASPEARELERYAVAHDGTLHRAGDLAGLFVMLKLDPATPGTDQGWIYATIDKDLTTITSMGVIESCVNCHKQTDRDRLYGKRASWPARWPDAPATAPADAPVEAPSPK